MNHAALGIATWYSVSVMKISSFLLKFGAFLASWDKDLLPVMEKNKGENTH